MEKVLQIAAAMVLSLLALTGCSDSSVPLGKVTGRVTLDGQPLAGALVRFNPEAGGRSSQGMTDANGDYTLDYSSRSEGALIGKSQVMITTGSLEDRKRRTNEKVPIKYND